MLYDIRVKYYPSHAIPNPIHTIFVTFTHLRDLSLPHDGS